MHSLKKHAVQIPQLVEMQNLTWISQDSVEELCSHELQAIAEYQETKKQIELLEPQRTELTTAPLLWQEQKQTNGSSA